MNPDDLAQHLQQFLTSRTAKALCHKYGADPQEAMGDLFVRMVGKQPKTNPKAWFNKSVIGLLKNYLCRNCAFRP